jgi:Skp family chaperone for outer membrane proteins
VGLLPDTSSSQPRPLNRLVARAMENLAARAAALVARIQEALGDEKDAAGDDGSDDNNASGVSSEDSAISSEQAESLQYGVCPE